VSPQTDAPAWRWSNIPIPQAHLVGLGTGILLQGVRPWRLPWPAWIGHGGGWPLLLAGLWLGAWAEQLVPDEVWAAIQPLLPPKRPHPKGGRPWIEDRAGLGGIIYVLRAGVPWRLPPAREFGCGSPVTCWRRLHDWQHAGVWAQLHHRLLDWLGDDGQVDWSRASIDSVSVRARRGGN
jgi:transposase